MPGQLTGLQTNVESELMLELNSPYLSTVVDML